MTFIDVLLLLIFLIISLRIFFPRPNLEILQSRFINELSSFISVSLLVLSLVSLLLYNTSILNVVFVVVTGLALFPMLLQVERRIFRGLALTSFLVMTAVFLFKLPAITEIFAVLSFSLFVIIFLKDFINEKQNEH